MTEPSAYQNTKAPFYERRWFQGTAAVVALVAACWALIGIPTPWDLLRGSNPNRSPHSSVGTEIILDTSAAMAAPFEGGTKLDAAVKALDEFLRPLQYETVALRRTGVGCDTPSELVAEFAPAKDSDIAELAQGLTPTGVPNLGSAIIAAVDDFADSTRFDYGGGGDRELDIEMPNERGNCA